MKEAQAAYEVDRTHNLRTHTHVPPQSSPQVDIEHQEQSRSKRRLCLSDHSSNDKSKKPEAIKKTRQGTSYTYAYNYGGKTEESLFDVARQHIGEISLRSRDNFKGPTKGSISLDIPLEVGDTYEFSSLNKIYSEASSELIIILYYIDI